MHATAAGRAAANAHPCCSCHHSKSLVKVRPAWLGGTEEGCCADDSAPEAAGGKPGLLGSFVRSMGTSITGTAALKREDIQPALDQLKRKLMERNVAEDISAKCASHETPSVTCFASVRCIAWTIQLALGPAQTQMHGAQRG